MGRNFEGLTVMVKAKIPRRLKVKLKERAEKEGRQQSRCLRDYLAEHMEAVEMADEVEFAPDNQMFYFKMTTDGAAALKAKKESLGCSVADLLASVLLREFG